MILYIMFSNPVVWWKQLGASLIRWADKSKHSHVAISLDTGDSLRVYEAVWPESHVLPFEEWQKSYKAGDIYYFAVPKGLELLTIDTLRYLTKRRYSISQLILIALTNAFGFLDRLLNKAVVNHEKGLICTELVTLYLERIGYLKIKESHDKVGVRDLERYCYDLYKQGLIKKAFVTD